MFAPSPIRRLLAQAARLSAPPVSSAIACRLAAWAVAKCGRVIDGDDIHAVGVSAKDVKHAGRRSVCGTSPSPSDRPAWRT
jgi:hypothetical protein